MKKGFIIVACLLVFACCTRQETVTFPNTITIRDKAFAIEQLRFDTYEMEYLDETKEECLAFRIVADGAVITADLPTRLLGEKITLTSRDTSPDTGGLYYTFYLSERDGGGEYGDWIYCAIRSWITELDPRSSYGGWFSIDGTGEPGEWIFEWELTSGNSEKIVSTGYVEGAFEPIS